MLIGIVSDVHCNIGAMDQALAELTPRVDTILVAGDAVLQYRFSNDVIERIRELDLPYIRGNHEWMLLAHGQRALSAPSVRKGNVEFMADAPERFQFRADGKRIMMVHASPFAPYSDYLYPGSVALQRCAEVDTDILILGHTHVPMATRVGDVFVVNPGSLGQGGDPEHPDEVSYAVLDTSSDDVTVHRFKNPQLSQLAP